MTDHWECDGFACPPASIKVERRSIVILHVIKGTTQALLGPDDIHIASPRPVVIPAAGLVGRLGCLYLYT